MVKDSTFFTAVAWVQFLAWKLLHAVAGTKGGGGGAEILRVQQGETWGVV